MQVSLHRGDCREVLRDLPDNSVDAVVTDPPYELGFMGKKWDGTGIAYSVEMWREVLRVLKPGGHLLAFGGTRTYHRMACAIEDAGFEIRDQIQYLYGSGFPKSYNISKGINAKQRVGTCQPQGLRKARMGEDYEPTGQEDYRKGRMFEQLPDDNHKEILTGDAQQWDGWGSALKPANEPVCLARKPLSEKTIVENVLKWGVGGLNIDGCRIGTEQTTTVRNGDSGGNGAFGRDERVGEWTNPPGRFPANIILDEEAGRMLDEQSGERSPGRGGTMVAGYQNEYVGGKANNVIKCPGYSDKGGASRFFYCAKASRSERNAGLDSYVTMKYNMDKSILGGLSWNDVSMVVVRLLRKATSDMEAVSFNIGESGESITVQCHKDSLSITSMEISKIIESKILNLLMPSHISEFIVDVNYAMGRGGSRVISAESSSQLQMNSGISQENATLLMVAVRNVISELLLRINERDEWKDASNFHSTVKPISLMRYLCRLITPPNGIVLDPFMGSGTTGCAAALEGFDFIGIEQDAEYIEIAKRRIEHWQTQFTIELQPSLI